MSPIKLATDTYIYLTPLTNPDITNEVASLKILHGILDGQLFTSYKHQSHLRLDVCHMSFSPKLCILIR